MIYARPSTPFEATLDGAPTGIAASLFVSVIDTPTGTVMTAETNTGITEAPAGSGLYAVSLTAPATPGQYSVVWRNPIPNPDVYIREDLFVSGVLPQDALAVSSPSGVNFGTLVANLRQMTAVSLPEAKRRINQAYRKMVAEGEALRQTVELGPTVIDQRAYELDPGIVSIPSLRVNGRPLERKSVDEIEDLNANAAYVIGRSYGYFAPDFSNAAAPEVLIYPTPATAGQTITARAFIYPPDLVDDGEYPRLPPDYHEDLVDAAMIPTLLRDDERLQDALVLEQRFKARIRELRGHQKRRVGRGVARIRLAR